MNKSLNGIGASPLSNPLDPYTGPWGFAEARHLVSRTMFGTESAAVASIQAMTISQAVDQLLTIEPETTRPGIWYHTDLNGTTEGDPWDTLPYDMTNDFNRSESLAGWWLSLMISQKVSIREKMTLFWHNHFACGMASVADARYSYRQNALLRANALGNFKDLVKSITLDPAMLRYLSGNSNVRSAPNENYGRELQELFTIGKGPEVSAGDYTTYTEADVRAAAHVLTGWKDDPLTQSYTFTPKDHDTSDKQFSARYGNKLIKGSSDEAGALREMDDLLTMIFSEEATARYICRKIYRWFVDYVVDTTIEDTVIGPLAQCLITNNFEIKPVLSLLFKSALFYDMAYRGNVIKTPLDLIVGSLRTLGVVMPTNEGTITEYYGWIALRVTGGNMQQTLLEPPNVAGWPAYYQQPEYHEIWLNSSTLSARIKFLDDIISNKYAIAVQTYYLATIDVTELARTSSDPSIAKTLIADWAALLYPNPLSTSQMTNLHDTLLPGLPEYEWTNEWNAFTSTPDDPTKKSAVSSKLTVLLKYMTELAEYQLM